MVTKALISATMKDVVITTTDNYIIVLPIASFRKQFSKAGIKKLFSGRIERVKIQMNKIKRLRPTSYTKDSIWNQYNNEIKIIKRLTK